MTALNMVVKETVDLEPADFLRMMQEHPGNIKHAEIVPPVSWEFRRFREDKSYFACAEL